MIIVIIKKALGMTFLLMNLVIMKNILSSWKILLININNVI